MTTMDVAIGALIEQPLEQEVGVLRKTTWPLAVILAVALHGAAFALILASSFAPRQAMMLADEVIPITLSTVAPVAAPAAEIHAQPTPQATPQTALQPPKPQHKPEPRTVTRSLQSAAADPAPPVALKPQPAPQATPPQTAATSPPAQGTEAAAAPAPAAVATTARSGEQGETANAVIPAQPRYRDNPPPAYPELARRRQIEGTVVLEALVNGGGRVDDLNVHASSGHTLLDDAALRAVRNWLFDPGKKGGMPMAMTVLVPVRFALR